MNGGRPPVGGGGEVRNAAISVYPNESAEKQACIPESFRLLAGE